MSTAMQMYADGTCHHTMPNGERCKRPPRKGGILCPSHGGNQRQVRQGENVRVARMKAEKKLAVQYRKGMTREQLKKRLQVLDELEDNANKALDFRDAVKALAAVEEGRLRYEGKTGEQIRGEIQLYTKSLMDCHKILTDILRLGIEEKKVEIQKEQAVAIAAALRAILNRLELSPEQQRLAPIVVKEEMQALSAAGG